MTYQGDLGSVKGLGPKERERFSSYAQYLSSNEPDLRLEFDLRAKKARIIGRLPTDIGAGVTRNYYVEVRFNQLDPFSAPEVWDRGRHFPPDGERHVEDHQEAGWRWCLWLPSVPEVDFKQTDALPRFLKKLRGFIRKQLIYDDRRRRGHPKPWPGDEWDHGDAGFVEWIGELLGDIDERGLKRLLPYLKGARLSTNKTCPCGSGKKAGMCHRAAAESIRTARDVVNVDKIISKLLTKKEKADARRST